MDELEYSASERSREDAYCEQYSFMQVTRKMNTKGHTWNKVMSNGYAH